MNVDRLRLMQMLLREVAAETWRVTAPTTVDMWTYTDDMNGTRRPVRMQAKRRLTFDLREWLADLPPGGTCGFAACAVGHACLDKRFTEAGLRMPTHSVTPEYLDDVGWLAVASFFGIEIYEAKKLFAARRGYTTPQDVIGEIDAFIDSRQA